jgi:histidine triad (HIT) family protein
LSDPCYNHSSLGQLELEANVTQNACIFCDIVRGDAPATVVYADDQAMAFMDIRPVNPGHLLVVPRAHATYLADLASETGGRLFRVGMKLAAAVRRSGVRCDGVNLFLADGEVAGQEVFHVHLHVIPRFRGDGFGFRFGPEYGRLPGRARLDELAAGIRQVLAD